MPDSQHDVIVVGAGAAGCVLADRLTEDSARSVLLLEAGADDVALAQAVSSFGRLPTRAGWNLTGTVPGWGTSFPVPRAKAVGGTSLLQGGVALRGLPADYDRWAETAGPEWSFTSARADFARIEHDIDQAPATVGTTGIRRSRPEERLPLHDAFLGGCAEIGIPYCDDLNQQTGTGCGLIPQARRGAAKETVWSTYLARARTRPNLTIVDRSEVRQVLIRGDRVTGVESQHTDRGVERHSAPVVVLAAGAVHSPLLLMRSGIGDPGTLAAVGLRCVVELPGVGHGLRDHPAIWTSFTVDPPPRQTDPLWFQVMMRHIGDDSDDLPDFSLEAFYDFRSLPSPDAWRRGLLVAALLAPEGVGSVRPDPRHPSRGAVVEFGYARDGTALRAATGAGHRLLRTAALKRLNVADFRLVSVTGHSGAHPRALPRALPITQHWDPASVTVTAHHLHGGCAMGTEPDQASVVDTGCRVFGVDGLFVGDVSVAPAPIRANTHLLALLVAEKLSRFITGP